MCVFQLYIYIFTGEDDERQSYALSGLQRQVTTSAPYIVQRLLSLGLLCKKQYFLWIVPWGSGAFRFKIQCRPGCGEANQALMTRYGKWYHFVLFGRTCSWIPPDPGHFLLTIETKQQNRCKILLGHPDHISIRTIIKIILSVQASARIATCWWIQFFDLFHSPSILQPNRPTTSTQTLGQRFMDGMLGIW